MRKKKKRVVVTIILHSVILDGAPEAGGDLGSPDSSCSRRCGGSVLWSSLRVMHDRLHIVPWEEPCHSIHDTLIPAVIVFLDDINDGTFLKRELVFFVLCVVIDRHH